MPVGGKQRGPAAATAQATPAAALANTSVFIQGGATGDTCDMAPAMNADTQRVWIPLVIEHQMTGPDMGRLEDSLH